MKAIDFLDGADDLGSSQSAESFLDAAEPKKQNKGILGDIGTGLKRGVEQMPGMVTGIADIAAAPVSAITGINRPFSRAADYVGEKTGFQPSKWAEQAAQEYSPEMQQSLKAVEQADGFTGTLKAIGENPRSAVNLIAESLPSTLAGGILARGAMGAVVGAEKLAAMKAAGDTAGLMKAGAIAGGIGEGAVTAGQQMSQTDYNVNPLRAAGSATAAGIGTGIIGGVSGRIANKIGLADIEGSIAAGTLGAGKKAGIGAYAGRIAGGAVQEGALEEMPQSAQEQVWQNVASSKPWDEGVGKASAQGLVAGMAMGAGVNALPGSKYAESKRQPVAEPPAADQPEIAGLLPAPNYTGTPSDQLLQAEAERQNAVDAAQKNADKLYAERAAYEEAMKALYPSGLPTLTTDPEPLQQRIDAMLGIDQNGLKGLRKIQYQKQLEAAFKEVVGITHDENGREMPLTMGALLDSQAMAEDAAKRQTAAENANTRAQGLADEESTQQPDIAPGYVPPVIPVVGPLSAIANAAVQSGAHQTAVMQQAAAEQAKAKPAGPLSSVAKQSEQANGQIATQAATQVAAPGNQAPGGELPGGRSLQSPAPTGDQGRIGGGAEVAAQGLRPAVSAGVAGGQAPNAVTTAPNLVTQSPNVATPASAFDVSGKNILQLKHLAAKGQPGWKEAATAELVRLNGSISESVPALNAGNSVNLPATSISSLQDQLDKTEPFSEQSQLLTERLQLAVTDDAKSAIGAGEMPVYKVTDHVSVAIHPSAQKEGMIQVTRYTKDGVIGDSQYNSIDEAVRFEGLTHKPRIPSNEAIAHIENSIAAEAEYQKRKNEQQAGAGLPASTAGGSRPAPVANQEPVKNQSEQPLDMVPSPIEQPVPEDYKGHLIYQSEMAGGKFMVRKKVGGELVGRGFVTAEEARATVDAVSQPKTGDTEKSVTGPLRITENADMGQFTARTATGESMGSFQIKDGKVANIKARAQWAMDDVRAAAEEYAKRQSQPKNDTAPESKQDQAPAITEPVDLGKVNSQMPEGFEARDEGTSLALYKDGKRTDIYGLSRVNGADELLRHAKMRADKAKASDADTRFASNTIFTADKVAAAKARMKAKLGTMNSGIDPELLIDGMTVAGAYIESGVRKFADYAKAMVEDLGDGVKPYLLSFYEAARAYPGLNKMGMDTAESAASQHQALLTPEVKEAAKEVIGEAPKVEKKKPASLGESIKMKADYGVENIDGYTRSKTGANQDTDYGLKGGIKDEFLADATRYLKSVAKILEANGFAAQLDSKGKPFKVVTTGEGGPAVGGDVYLRMSKGGFEAFAKVGVTNIRGMGPAHPQGVSLMTRVGERSGMNNWLATDLTAGDLSAWFDKQHQAFAKRSVEVKPAAPAKESYDLSKADDKFKVATEISDFLIGGGEFKTIIEARKKISEMIGRPIEAATELAKQADETIETAVVMAGRDIVKAGRKQGRTPEVIYTRLVDLYRRQPNLAVRSSTSVRDQAYSTTVPLAYLASELAGITYDTKVLEPTAGNGMLLIGASVGNSVVNELNPDRADVLRSLGFNPTERNAATEQLRHAGYPVDAVIANPPFGATKDANGETIVYDIKPGFKTREVDHAIVFKSLETMKDDGRAVLIVGGVQAEAEEARREDYRGANKRSFYFNLYNEYNVIDHFTVDGGLYSKQGASYPVDIIVIDGRGKSSRDMPAADLPVIYKSYDALKEKLNGNGRVESEPVVGASGTDSGNGQAGNGDTPAVAGSPVGSSVKDGNGSAAGVSAGGVRNDGTADNGRPSGSGAVSSGGQSESPNASGPVDGVRVSDANRNAEAGSKAGNRGNGSADLGGVSVVNGERVESGLTDRRGKEQETGHQVAYTPHSNAASVGTLVPRAMKDSIAASLQKISDEVGSIDDYVAESLAMDLEDVKANFSAEQIDALALAIRNAEAGKGFIIGDQTGIGKGRVVAAMIRYALVTGKTPIFVTEKPNLYSDMIRDLDDIGMTAELALDTKNPKVLITNGGESIPYTLLRTENGEVVENNLLLRAPKSGKALDQIMQGMMDGDSLGEYKVIFTTYSQLQTVKGATTTRQKFIQRFGEGNYMVFDESHNAGGAGETQARTKEQRQAAKDGESLVTGRAAFVRNLVQKAFGTFFSSATYAKRPDVMDLYSSTNMKLAVDKISQLGEAIKAGGVPMQQVVANMLTKDGQYIRRERTFAGVSYDTQETKVDKVTAENMASAMRSILAFSRAKDSVIKEIQKEMDREGGMINEMGGEKSSVQGANFGSIMHNLIDQMLLSLKVQDSVSHAIERLKAGEKVVLTVSNTMGSFLKDYSEELGIATGDPVSMSFADLYNRYLEKQRNVTIKDGGGNKRQHRLTDAELGPRLVDMFNAVRKQIESSGFGSAPISPIDYMHNELRKAGYKTDEITGRTIALNYSSGTPILASRTANIRQRVKAVSGFNNGETDVLILNQAGSTGLSLHASSKFKDQRKRHMIIVQAEKNIDTHMQMLGRVHRTGQVVAPAYSQMMADIPAEMRPASVLMKKMASLNANTTASRTSSVTAEGVVDFMNNYGGQVVHEYLRDNPDVLEAVGGNKVISLADDPAEAGEDDIRKFTGYIPILPIKQQEEVYRELVDRYNELIERENSLGTNKLEAKAVDLDAETISSQTVTEDRGDPSVFASPANMEKVDVKRTVKPYSSEEVAAMVSESLDGKTANQVAATQLADLFDKATAYGKEKVAKMVADEVDPVKLDSQKAQLQLVLSHARTVLNTYKIGDSISVKDQIGQFVYGVITKIERSGRTANPAAGSAWKMHVALANGDAKSITLSFSQIGSKYELRAENRVEWYNTDTQSVERIPVSDIFDKGAKVRREKRWIVTGNILAGFARFPGQIITYTKNDGTTAQGVLMSRQFDFEKEQKNAPVRIKDGKAAIKFFTNGGQGGIIGTPDRFLMIAPRRGEFEITVPSSRKDGGTYYLDTGLTNIVGDFYKRGSIMSASVYTTGDVERVVNYLVKDREETIIALSNVEKAKELLEGKPVALLSIAGREKFDPISLDTAAGVVARMRQTIKEVWKVDLRLVPTFSALPQEVKDAIAKYGEDTRAKGVLHKGSVYIVADEHASDADVETTILHEIKGHVGLRRLYSDAINKGLGALYMSIGGRRGLADLAKARGFTDELQGYAESLSNSDFTDEERTRIVMEELLSHIAQDPKFGDKVKAIVGKIRAWLRDNGFMALAKFGEADLLNILAKASKALETVRDDNGPVVLMTAWHGSPHDHNKFDSSKIGTGEGAQAYGFGLYFAGARSVAEYYRDALRGKSGYDLSAKAQEFGFEINAGQRGEVVRQVQAGKDDGSSAKRIAKRIQNAKSSMRDIDSAALERLVSDFMDNGYGKLYQVELAPSEDEYLDWDKPLSEQSDTVKAALDKVGLPKKYHSENKTGSEIYRLLSQDSASHITGKLMDGRGDKAASEYLHSLGIRGIRYLDGSSRSKGEGNSNYVIFSDDDVTITAKYNIASKDKLTPADKAIYGMAAEGKSAAEVLKFIASASRNPFNRQVARLLMKTGIAPSITVGDGKGWKMNAGDGNKYAAAYNPKSDTVSLFRPASAERNMLHELIHAATLKALSKKGMASAQMNALYQHVKKSDKLKGMYGMSDVDEFIAEAFSNPKFQAALKQVSAAPVGVKPSSSWDWFIRVVRVILGLKQGQDNALSQALDIGVGVMRENMALQSGDGVIRFNHALRSTPEGNRPLNAIRLANLRRIAAGLERPKDAVFLRVTEDGKAITTGPKGVRIPETFIRFAESNGLDFEARRNGEGRKSDGHTVGDHITSKTEPMPEEYRESGALYFGEGNEFFDRTGKTRYNAAPGKINQTDTAAFKRWFGDSKVVDSDGKPLVVYHGTQGDFSAFDPSISGSNTKHPTASLGIFLTSDPVVTNLFVRAKPNSTEENDARNAAGRASRSASLAAGFNSEFEMPVGSDERKSVAGLRTAAYDAANYRHGANVMPVYVSIKNPLRLTWEQWERAANWMAGTSDHGMSEIRAMIAAGNHDGIILPAQGWKEYAGDTYVAFRPEQIKSAIGNNGNFDASNPDIRYNVADKGKIVGDSGRQYDQGQRQFFKNVGRDVSPKGLIERTKDYLQNDFWKKMAVGIVDQFRGLRDLNDNGQAYMLARLSKGTAGAFETLLHHGKLSIKDGVYDGDQSGGFIEKLGVPLQGELDDFLWWVAANRAEGLAKNERENLFTPADIAAGKSLASGETAFDYTIQTGLGKGRTTRSRSVMFADAQRVFNEFQKNSLDIAEQSGLIDGAARKFWESEFYVPFYRVSEEDGEFIGAKMGQSLVRQQAFKKLKGGTDKLNSDLLSNTLLNWSHLIEASAKNRAAKAALVGAENVGAAQRVAGTMAEYAASNGAMLPPGTKQTVWFQENGQKVEYLVTDPFVMTAITSLEYAGLRSPMWNVLTTFKHWLTIGVTASPAFKVRNLIRDSIQAIGTSDLGYNPITNIKEGFKASARDKQEYVSALASGGLIRFGTMLEGSESSRVRQLIKSGVKDSSILDSEPKWRQFYDKFLEPGISAYNELGNRSEEITRAALYNQLIKQGKSHAEAALMARDLMDFSMQGSFVGIRILTQIVPFMNARLQGMYKLGRSAKDNPRKLAIVTGAVAMASIALMLGYEDDDDWKRREDWDRDNFWWFKFGGIEYRIPKPFEVGAVGTLAERSVEYLINDEMTGERFRKVASDLVLHNLSMNPIPQAFKPIVDLYANKDSFTGRPIETMSMQRLDPTMRYNSNTSLVARGLSTATGGLASPVQYDHMARAYFDWLGAFVIGGADMIARPMTNEPEKPERDYWKFATQGILKEQGSGNSRYLTMVYDQAHELEQAHATHRQMIKEGKIDDAREYAEDNAEKLKRYRMVEQVKRTEAKFNENIRAIERGDLDPEEKKLRIERIQQMKENVAKRIAPGIQ